MNRLVFQPYKVSAFERHIRLKNSENSIGDCNAAAAGNTTDRPENMKSLNEFRQPYLSTDFGEMGVNRLGMNNTTGNHSDLTNSENFIKSETG